MRRIGDDVEKARHGVHLGGIGEFLRFDLVAHGDDRPGFRPDEDDALLLQRFAKGGALGQEAIAGMNGLSAGRLAGGNDLVGDEIALGGRRRTDMHRLVSHLDMNSIAIRIGIDRHRGDTHFPCRLDHAAGNFPTVGNQDFLEHFYGPPAQNAPLVLLPMADLLNCYCQCLHGKQAG